MNDLPVRVTVYECKEDGTRECYNVEEVREDMGIEFPIGHQYKVYVEIGQYPNETEMQELERLREFKKDWEEKTEKIREILGWQEEPFDWDRLGYEL